MNGTDPVSGRGHLLRPWFHIVGLVLIALYLLAFAARNLSLQWDLKTYLAAARAALAGLDPYRLENLTAISGRNVPLPFLYPPVALVPFFLMAGLPTATALALWMGTKILLLAALVFAWARWFVPRAGPLPIAMLAVFGWNAAALWDLRAGNVALIECTLLWGAFGCYVAGRRSVFAALVVTAACFKLTPAVFLLLLMVPTERNEPSLARWFASIAALAVLVWGPLVVGPGAHWEGFMRHVPSATGLGDANPSAFELASTLAKATGLGGPTATRLAVALWGAYVLALGALSLPFLRRAWKDRDPIRWVMVAVFLELLIAPRPMAYGFVRLTPAPLFLLPEPYHRPVSVLALALILSAQGLARAARHELASPLVTFAPFLLTLAVWLVIVRDSRPQARFPQ